MDKTSPFIELNDPPSSWGQFGDIGGESDGEETGGVDRIEVGEVRNDPLAK